jgi:hypothetical protein
VMRAFSFENPFGMNPQNTLSSCGTNDRLQTSR